MAASVSTADQRAKAAVLGALVADAATMGVHWLYDQEALAKLLNDSGKMAEPEFFPPINRFYTHADGEFSPYGYELFGHLTAIAQQGKVEGDALAKALAVFFKNQKDTDHYLNRSSKYIIENVEAGKAWPETGEPADAQANAFVKAPAVVALLHGTPEIRAGLKTAILAQQNNDPALAAGLAGGLILEKVVLGHSIEEAVAWALSAESGLAPETQEHLKTALGHREGAFSETVKTLGPACSLPASLQNSVVAGVKFGSYVEGVRANMIAGGDNASRNVLIGALLAAQFGMESIPESWRARTKHYAEAEKLVDQVLAARSKATVKA